MLQWKTFTPKQKEVVERWLDATTDLAAVDLPFAIQLMKEIVLLLENPMQFIAACDPADRADALAMLRAALR